MNEPINSDKVKLARRTLLAKSSTRKSDATTAAFEWASHHFAIDDFYDDEEDLIDHIKFIISSDNIHLYSDKKYKFITEIIGRSAQSYRYLG